VAAAASLLVVVGLGLAVSGRLPGAGGSGSLGTVIAPHHYYIENSFQVTQPVVRSTVTGAMTATVPVPRDPDAATTDIVSSAANGWYFAVANVPNQQAQRIYRFQVTDTGRVTRFSAVPGARIGNSEWTADAASASPDGSQLAVAVSYQGRSQCPHNESSCLVPGGDTYPDYIVTVNAATGAERIWQGGLGGRGTYFSISSLSWTGNGRELVFLGETCGGGSVNSQACQLPVKGRTFTTTRIIRALDPATRGGLLTSGPVLLRQSARVPHMVQALISPDGTTITAVVLTGKADGGFYPHNLTVEQISVATGKVTGVLYRRELGSTDTTIISPDPIALYPDATGRHWMLNSAVCGYSCQSAFNGWLDHGELVPLQPSDGKVVDETW
jgi:hypothetical protein